MRVFLAGGTGAIGRPLLQKLVDAGHRVTAMTRSGAKAATLRAPGIEPVVCDVFDAARLRRIVHDARPQIVIHELTDIPPALDADPAAAERQLAGNRRIRIEGTRNLVEAALAAGASGMVAESIAFAYAPIGGRVKVEADPLGEGASADAVRELESAVAGAEGLEGIVLRYGYFYGPGTFYAKDGSISTLVMRGELPLAGDGDDIASFVHVDDAASATVLALEGPPGIYNIVDDDPAPERDWLPALAVALGAPPPPRVPATQHDAARFARGASNAKAKQQLGWVLRYPTWRDGLKAAVS